MRFNENIAISTSKVLLVPYDAHHVPRYHRWMEDAAIREATASERLTLEEEYENQVSWREASDKLTFIICEPIAPAFNGDVDEHDNQSQQEQNHHHSNQKLDAPKVVAGIADTPGRMVGDINLFLTPWEDPEDDKETNGEINGGTTTNNKENQKTYCAAEIDIMIADQKHRGKGLGRATVATFLLFIQRNLDGILSEYVEASADAGKRGGNSSSSTPVLKELVAKINVGNTGSIALFKSLGFRQRGDVNYFGEIEMVLEGFGAGVNDGDDGLSGEDAWAAAVRDDGYRELGYDRSRLEN
ncbi:GNAT domain-containing protein [Hypoxylon sp. FL0890]|nr:GNAT domain-containing protein [Hypoxylon sp. FL0890]